MRVTKREWSLELTSLREFSPEPVETSIIERHGIAAVATQIDVALREVLEAMISFRHGNAAAGNAIIRFLFSIARLSILGIIFVRKEMGKGELSGSSKRNS